MGKQVQKIRVFVATPSDVQEERKILRKVIEELNRMFGENYNTILDFIRWETHAVPDMGRAQAIINQQIGPYDIFLRHQKHKPSELLIKVAYNYIIVFEFYSILRDLSLTFFLQSNRLVLLLAPHLSRFP